MPVLPWTPRSVAVGDDLSQRAASSLQAVAGLPPTTIVHVLHVAPAPITAIDVPLDVEGLDLTAQLGALADEREAALRDALRERARDAGIANPHVHILGGDPGTELADAADRLNVDVLVLCSRGRTGLAAILLGSTASRVLRLARCPVLVLPDPLKE